MKNTNPRTNPSPEETAAATYAHRHAQIRCRLELITKGLDDHARQFENGGGTNWAMVGDLGKVANRLAEIARSLGLGN